MKALLVAMTIAASLLFPGRVEADTVPLSRVCVTMQEYNTMPRTNKGAIERHLGMKGVRDRSYEETAAAFGFDPKNRRLFDYPRCNGGQIEILYQARKNKPWLIIYSSY